MECRKGNETMVSKRIEALIPRLMEKWEPIIGVKVESWGVKLMKTRWAHVIQRQRGYG